MMPCTKCNADFNILNWKIKCTECEESYCSKCVRKQDGYHFCGVCTILVRRPPVRESLMQLKSKDLQQYLNKNHISTHGLVEKTELVELFCRLSIPVRYKKANKKFPINIGGSVPDLAARSQTYLNNLRSNAEAAFQNTGIWPNSPGGNQTFSATTSPLRPNLSTSGDHHGTSRPDATNHGRTNADRSHVSGTPRSHNGTASDHPPAQRQRARAPAPPSQQATPSAPAPPAEEYHPPRHLVKLSDFTSEEELNELSVKQLKELLTLNRVDYKGCVEKGELLERVTMLWIDSNLHKNDNFDGNMGDCCKICMDAPLDCVLLECGHMATCLACGKQLAECPICRQYVTRVVRTFKA